jgi:hypothetical protein
MATNLPVQPSIVYLVLDPQPEGNPLIHLLTFQYGKDRQIIEETRTASMLKTGTTEDAFKGFQESLQQTNPDMILIQGLEEPAAIDLVKSIRTNTDIPMLLLQPTDPFKMPQLMQELKAIKPMVRTEGLLVPARFQQDIEPLMTNMLQMGKGPEGNPRGKER